ncbi:MAG: hypothetical protein CSA09_04480 [Candidatus Contendobacter odensis]|uniref:RDD domain-containing protein n=1 Tax=Candidatus Contendibacter odensensis TaxID=1400860 RepID=A0A2G6PFC8_9GAMM|nr:MAG: hypothetical protein CSA09_04480 [Candidatus Contendobacter odensis]
MSDRTPTQMATLPRRLAAVLYDSFLLAAVLFAAAGLALALMVLINGSESLKIYNPLMGNPLFSIYLLLVCFLFYGGFWMHGGQTLGMRAWRLRVQQRDGRSIHWQQALLRFLSASLWLIPIIGLPACSTFTAVNSLIVGLGCLTLILALRLPDRLSGTELVLLPKLRSDRENPDR